MIKQPLVERVLKLKFSRPDSWLFDLVPGSYLPGGENGLSVITNAGKSLPQACLRTLEHEAHVFLSHSKFVCVLDQEKAASRYLNWVEGPLEGSQSSLDPGQGQGEGQRLNGREWLQLCSKAVIMFLWEPLKYDLFPV